MFKHKWIRPGLTSLAAAMILLSACATAHSEPPVQAPVLICPRVVEYSDEFLNRAADAVQALPADSPIVVLLSDFGEGRARARACHKATAQ